MPRRRPSRPLTSPGIEPVEIPRILEPHGRTEAAETGAAEGTGLGLTLVKAMIEAHGGALEIESKLGAGSTFTLRFPPARAGLAAAPGPSAHAKPASAP